MYNAVTECGCLGALGSRCMFSEIPGFLLSELSSVPGQRLLAGIWTPTPITHTHTHTHTCTSLSLTHTHLSFSLSHTHTPLLFSPLYLSHSPSFPLSPLSSLSLSLYSFLFFFH